MTAQDFANPHVVSAGPDRGASEGMLVALSATTSDPTPATPSTFTFLWQVAADNGQVIPNSSAQTLNFTPVDNGIYTVTLSATDTADNKVYQDTAFVFVSNVAPALNAGANETIPETPEGGTFTRSVSFTDPGADVWTATVSFGDGSPVENLTGVTPGRPFTLNHLYVNDGQYPVLLTVNDDDGGEGAFAVWNEQVALDGSVSCNFETHALLCEIVNTL